MTDIQSAPAAELPCDSVAVDVQAGAIMVRGYRHGVIDQTVRARTSLHAVAVVDALFAGHKPPKFAELQAAPAAAGSASADEPDVLARIERQLAAIEKHLSELVRATAQMGAYAKQLEDGTIAGMPAPQVTE